jgi:hypothetical protein
MGLLVNDFISTGAKGIENFFCIRVMGITDRQDILIAGYLHLMGFCHCSVKIGENTLPDHISDNESKV